MSHTQSEVSLPNVHPMLPLAIVIVDGRVCFFSMISKFLKEKFIRKNNMNEYFTTSKYYSSLLWLVIPSRIEWRVCVFSLFSWTKKSYFIFIFHFSNEFSVFLVTKGISWRDFTIQLDHRFVCTLTLSFFHIHDSFGLWYDFEQHVFLSLLLLLLFSSWKPFHF